MDRRVIMERSDGVEMISCEDGYIRIHTPICRRFDFDRWMMLANRNLKSKFDDSRDIRTYLQEEKNVGLGPSLSPVPDIELEYIDVVWNRSDDAASAPSTSIDVIQCDSDTNINYYLDEDYDRLESLIVSGAAFQSCIDRDVMRYILRHVL